MVVFSYPIKLRTGFIFILTKCFVQILKGKNNIILQQKMYNFVSYVKYIKFVYTNELL